MGNILTKNDIQKIALKQKGGSTLGGRQVWFDRDVLRLNYDNRGEHLGEFQSDDLILVVSAKGNFYTSNFDLNNHYDKDILAIEKFDANKVWTVALWDAEQKFYYLKRFQLEPSAKPQNLLGDNTESRLMLMTDVDYPRFEVVMGGHDAYREALVIDAEEFIGVKSYKAKGKRLTTFEVETINEMEPTRFAPVKEVNPDENEGESDEILDETEVAEIEEIGNIIEEIDITDIQKKIETVTKQEIPKADEPEAKAAKLKKEKTIKTIPNDSVLPDDIVENNGQLTLF
jgi:topoisomerase-4 subunit A